MKEQFVTYEIALKLKELGFDEECFGAFITKDRGYLIVNTTTEFEFGIRLHQTENSTLAPLWQQAIDWFDKQYGYDIVVLKESVEDLVYYWYYITGSNNDCYSDLTDWQTRHGDLLEECSQDIPGDYLNREKFNKLIFERQFAFHTKSEACKQAILKAIELLK